jgi:hypothetical protein
MIFRNKINPDIIPQRMRDFFVIGEGFIVISKNLNPELNITANQKIIPMSVLSHVS